MTTTVFGTQSNTNPPETAVAQTQYVGPEVLVANADGKVGFYGTAPIVKPTLGGSDAAAVIAALVALGLVNAA